MTGGNGPSKILLSSCAFRRPQLQDGKVLGISTRPLFSGMEPGDGLLYPRGH